MQVNDIVDKLKSMSYQLSTDKLVSLIHRVKVKENPNEKIFKSIQKMLSSYEDEDIQEIRDFCSEIDFENISKPKHGGRGPDKSKRRPAGQAKKYIPWSDGNGNTWEDECERQADLGPDASWCTPPNM